MDVVVGFVALPGLGSYFMVVYVHGRLDLMTTVVIFSPFHIFVCLGFSVKNVKYMLSQNYI